MASATRLTWPPPLSLLSDQGDGLLCLVAKAPRMELDDWKCRGSPTVRVGCVLGHLHRQGTAVPSSLPEFVSWEREEEGSQSRPSQAPAAQGTVQGVVRTVQTGKISTLGGSLVHVAPYQCPGQEENQVDAAHQS